MRAAPNRIRSCFLGNLVFGLASSSTAPTDVHMHLLSIVCMMRQIVMGRVLSGPKRAMACTSGEDLGKFDMDGPEDGVHGIAWNVASGTANSTR